MLRNLENMARSGNRDMAQQMLSQLRDLLDRLQSGRMADQGQSQRFGQMMDEFGNIIGREQQLLDDTFGELRQQGEGPARPTRPAGQQGQRGQRGQQGQQGQGRATGRRPGAALGDRQRELRDMLGRLQRGMREFGLNPPGQFDGADDAMERAERALREGNLDGARRRSRARSSSCGRVPANGPADAAADAVALSAQRQCRRARPYGPAAAAHRRPRSRHRREGARPDRCPARARDPGGAAPAVRRADAAGLELEYLERLLKRF